ncbi:MAG: flagellar motor switch protein FliN [Treponemataceae bacterium]|nr:MAG: flagellar motor switch protein FliN [Treponemataceae bacterium]
MSDGAISQDEIEALLNGGGGSAPPAASINVAPLTGMAQELIAALAENLGTATGGAFTAGSPTVEALTRNQFLTRLSDNVVSVSADYSQGIIGEHTFLLDEAFAQKLVGLINKEEAPTLDDMSLTVLSEIITKHIEAQKTAITATGKVAAEIMFASPVAIKSAKADVRFPPDQFVLFSYPVVVEGTTYTLYETAASTAASTIIVAFGGNPSPAVSGSAAAQNAGGGVFSQNLGGFGASPNVQGLDYPNLAGLGGGAGEQGNIGLIMDVFMEMTVELGRTKKQIKEILSMGEGTIVELDKLAGEPVDILVNHKLIAKGEVVVIDENFGVRVTEILSPNERLNGLQ